MFLYLTEPPVTVSITLEPVGSVIPKLTSGDESRAVRGTFSGSIVLICPAQAFPVPFSRYVISLSQHLVVRLQIGRRFIDYWFLEPVGSVGPRWTAGTSKIQTLDGYLQTLLTLLCPAQAYPVPLSRYTKPIIVKVYPVSQQNNQHHIFL